MARVQAEYISKSDGTPIRLLHFANNSYTNTNSYAVVYVNPDTAGATPIETLFPSGTNRVDLFGGYYMVLRRESSYNYLDGYDSNGVACFSTIIYRDARASYIGFAWNDDSTVANTMMMFQNSAGDWVVRNEVANTASFSVPKAETYRFATQAIAPEHDYKPLYNLHSSNQIFTLTTIGKNPNDGTEVVLAPAEDIISWSEQSRLRDYIINLRESNRFAKMFTLNEHKYIGLKVNSYTVDGGLGYWDCTIGFYIDGVRQESLNLPILANTITDINNSWGFYFAISVDTENGACLPTIVYKDVTTGNVSYQRESYSDVNGLYEYLSPFFGATIDPENPDIPIVDPTPTTDGQTGGGGTWWSPDTPVLVPELPSTGVTECGFMSLYKMTNTQLNALASYLWSDDFLDEVKKFFSDPMQMIISCKMLPYSVSASSTTETIQAGNVATTCTGYKIYGNNQYTKVDCGEILLPERTKTYLDYSPYCSAQIFLPFIGMRPIDVDTCVGHRIGVKYNCDCLTGQSVCFVTIDGNVAYTYECNIGMDIPISSESYHGIMGALTSALNVPLSVGTAIATGGMSVPLSGASLVSSAVGMANGSRPTIERSGSVSGVGGFLNHRQPFLLIEYTDPIQATNQKHFMGAPTNKTIKLKNCKGLTTVEQTYLSILEATEEEKAELLELLKGGALL